MLAAGRPDLSARSASSTCQRAEDAVQAVFSGAEIKSLAHEARVKLNEQHRTSASAHNRHMVFQDCCSSSATSITGSFEEVSQEGKPRALLLLYLEPKRPVHEVEIQVIQFQVSKSVLAGSLHQRLFIKCAPQLEAKSQGTP